MNNQKLNLTIAHEKRALFKQQHEKKKSQKWRKQPTESKIILVLVSSHSHH